MNYLDSKNLFLKVKNIGNGKYDVGIKDETLDYFIFVTVKFSHIDKDVYIYDVISYEIHTLMQEVNYYEDISGVASEKVRLINLYKSQVKVVNYADAIMGLNKYRGIMRGNSEYAEAFKVEKINKS